MSVRPGVSSWPKTCLGERMFEPTDSPRVFGVPLGVDFPRALVDGLLARHRDAPPEALAKVQLFVNTRRMARRVRALFDEGPPSLLPRIDLVTDLGDRWAQSDLPAPVSRLRRRLEFVQLVSALLDRQPDLAPRSALFDLAESLADLMDELHDEGVSPDCLDNLNIEDQSGHWSRIATFLGIVRDYLSQSGALPDTQSHARVVIERLAWDWKTNPPDRPIIVAGSTGSRGTTQLLMRAVAALPQGAVILPGLDTDMPRDVWDRLDNGMTCEDHPQYRFADFARRLGVHPKYIARWTDQTPANPARNHVVSLALRPAPVTDQWLRDGPKLRNIASAMQDVTLLAAPSTRTEALAIAMRLRQAAETGQTAALITPERTLTRQVTAALDRWRITPDDSAGIPLHHTPPGRFLRHVADLFHEPLTAESLLTLLKHPLTHSGADRGTHLELTRALELHFRRHGPPYPKAEDIRTWSDRCRTANAGNWAEWVISCLAGRTDDQIRPLSERVSAHLDLAELIARGPDAECSCPLWQGDDGEQAFATVSDLAEHADAAGDVGAWDYATLLLAILSREEVRRPVGSHPSIRIWGTLEARVQGADLLILAGLNEGVWPDMPAADPWLNRALRHQAGLLLPERRIGLAAHDFQQAILAPEVWLTRSIRSDDAETVPSRWLNRLQNLLSGLAGDGARALDDMTARGAFWLQLAGQLENAPATEPAKRPSPRPPVDTRPRQLSVTEVKRLIRDPYAIYAKHVLRLQPLDPLMRAPDALLRGSALHDVLEQFVLKTADDPSLVTREILMATAAEILKATVPWADARAMWLAKLGRAVDTFIDGETARRLFAHPAALEVRGNASLQDPAFTLTAKADRIDIDRTGNLHIYDYKTGNAPSPSEQRVFDKQLLLEAAIAQIAGFGDLPPSPVARAAYISLGSGKPEVDAPIDTESPEKVWTEFGALIGSYLSVNQGYTSRRAMQKSIDAGDYDQLARFGEWDVTDDPEPVVLG